MNSFGRIFRVSIFGESHGDYVGSVIDGCPPGINLSTDLLHFIFTNPFDVKNEDREISQDNKKIFDEKMDFYKDRLTYLVGNIMNRGYKFLNKYNTYVLGTMYGDIDRTQDIRVEESLLAIKKYFNL